MFDDLISDDIEIKILGIIKKIDLYIQSHKFEDVRMDNINPIRDNIKRFIKLEGYNNPIADVVFTNNEVTINIIFSLKSSNTHLSKKYVIILKKG